MRLVDTPLLLLLLWLAGARGRMHEPLAFAVRHGNADDSRVTALMYVGHPPRAAPFTLMWALPGAPLDVALDSEHVAANKADLPGRVPALFLPASDALVPFAALQVQHSVTGNALAVAAAATTTDGEGASPVSFPQLQVRSRGSETWLAANVTSSGADLYGRALFAGPGSTVYLRWRFATLDRARLRFTNTPPLDHARAVRLQCAHFDLYGRCVLDDAGAADTLALVAHSRVGATGASASARPVADAGALRFVLDWESSASVLPAALYQELQSTPTATETRMLTWHGHVLATSDATEAQRTARSPEFVVSASENATRVANGGQLVVKLGRRTLERLFARVVYDSSAAAFYVTFAEPLAETVRRALAVLVTLQVFLVVRYFVSPHNLRLQDDLAISFRARAPVDLAYATAADKPGAVKRVFEQRLRFQRDELVDAAFAAASFGVAIALLVLGYLYTGAGADVDLDLAAHLRTIALLALVSGCVEMGLWLLAFFAPHLRCAPAALGDARRVAWRSPPITLHLEWADWLLYRSVTYTLYAHVAGLSIVCGLLLVAGPTMVGLVTVAMTALIFNVLLLVYASMNTLIVCILRAGQRAHSTFRVWAGLVGVVFVGLVPLHAYYMYAHLFVPLIAAWDASYSLAFERGAALAVLGVAALAATLLAAAQVLVAARAQLTRDQQRHQLGKDM